MRKNCKIAAVILAVIVMMFTLLGCGAAGSPDKLAEKVALATMKGEDVSAYYIYDQEKYAAVLLEEYSYGEYYDEDTGVVDTEKFYEKLSDTLDEDIKTWDEYVEYNARERQYELEDNYGEELEFKADARKTKEITYRELEEAVGEVIIEHIDMINGDDLRDSLSEIYKVEVKYKIKGDYDETSGTGTCYIGKTGSGYKVIEIDY